jgi:hypothetical protein
MQRRCIVDRVVQQVRQTVDRMLSSVPPIMMLDAIWITLLKPTTSTHQNRQGRRVKKKGKKVCVLVAQTGITRLFIQLDPSQSLPDLIIHSVILQIE